ncbi:MAG: PilT/PilU family type 4a pilus ATPase [Dehalococcoidia bacterium]
MERIGVFLVDSQVVHREGMKTAFSKEDDIEVLGETDDGKEALHQIKAVAPHVVILDSNLHSVNGFDLTRQIRRYSPLISVVMFASGDDDDHFFLAIRAGAAGCLNKRASYEELICQVRKAYRGEYPINEGLITRPGVALRVLQQFQEMLAVEREVEPLILPLSRRETEILEHIARGNANKEIAHALGISNQTVKNHVASIMRKLAANDRTHAVVLALRHGLITVREFSQHDNEVHIDELLKLVVEKGASDLHLKVGRPPVLRINGELIAQDQLPTLTPQSITKVVGDIMTKEQETVFARDLELDLALSLPGIGRFRASVSLQRGTLALSFRHIPTEIPTIDELKLPDVCKMLAMKQNGLVLVTGPAGSGKSTTLAAMIEHLNKSVSRRVITIEDPIEFLHADIMCFISQRELGSDTRSFAVALKHALRQDPDVILVGEMRDLETIATVLTAAETGHLVLATLHTPSAAHAIDRIIDAFSSHQQQQARIQLSTTLQGVLYQTLLPSVDGQGRVVAVEVMIATDAIGNLIREAKTPQMVNVMQTGAQYGMQTLDQALIDLWRRGLIRSEDAFRWSRDAETARKAIAAFATH